MKTSKPAPKTASAKTKSPATLRAASRATRPPAAVDAAPDGEIMLQILSAMVALRQGDFSARLPVEWTGVSGKIADAFNEVALMSERSAAETARVCRAVGKEGRLSQRLSVPGVAGGWPGLNICGGIVIEHGPVRKLFSPA